MERLADCLEPFLTNLPAFGDRVIGRGHRTVEDGTGQKGSSFQGSDVTLTGAHDPAESVEQVWIVVPPLNRSAEVANVPTIRVVMFVRIEPPCDAEPVSCRQRPEDADLEIVADVADVAVLHQGTTSCLQRP